jgi:hypothetical protein
MARPRSQTQVLEIRGFHGGAQLLTDPDKLKPEQALRFINYLLDELGSATKRLGCHTLGSVGAAGTRGISGTKFQRAGQTTQYIVHLDDGTVRYSTDLINWTTMRSGLSTTAPMSYATFNNKLYMANGVDNYYEWDGSAGTAYAAVPKFKYLEEWKDGLWGAATTADPDIVYASEAGDATTWGALDFVYIAKGNGPGITGLASDANALVIFKHLETHALYDPVEFTNRVVDTEKGCLSHFSIVKHQGLIYFISHEGACLYLGDAPSQIISQAIQPVFKNYIYAEGSEQFIYGYSFEDRVGWSWPRDSVSDFNQSEFYPELPESPWIFHDMPVRLLIGVKDPGSTEKLYGFAEASNATMQVYRPAVHTDLSAAITSVIQTGWFDFDLPSKKYMDRVLVRMRGDATLELLTDFDPTTAVETHTITGDGGMDEQEIFTDLYFTSVAFRFSNTETTGLSFNKYVGNEAESLEVGDHTISSMRAFAKACGDGR